MSVPPQQNPAPISIVPDVPSVYSLFSALSALSGRFFNGHIGGKLLLYGQLDAMGAAAALAGNIAGAATLGIDDNPERLKQGIRYGYCDFMVNNLDEALRILKNELRKKQPVSVCLEAEFAATLQVIVERGVQPDVLSCSLESGEVATLLRRGAVPLAKTAYTSEEPRHLSFTDITWTARSAAAHWLPKVDALAAQVLPAEDFRRRWLTFAPRYLGRTVAGKRYLTMTPAEAEEFSAVLATAVASGAIGTQITIVR